MAQDESPGAGSLYRLDPDHEVTRVLAGVSISNGIGWSPDESRMYYIDSLTYAVDVLDYDTASGAIGNRRVFASAGGDRVMPDGLTVDADGCVWVALWGGGALLRYRPDGRLEQTLQIPAAHVTSCAFGGPGMDTLYITTAAGPGTCAGALLACRPGTTGLPAHPFRG
jgi:sugar lactone lactonase YvrE